MNIMSRFSLTAAIVLLIGAAAVAQPMRMSAEDRAKSLKDSLKLTDEQTAKVTVILKDQQEFMRGLMGGDGDRETMRSAMMEEMKKTDVRIDSLLTPDQKKKYDEMKKNRMSMRPRMRGGN